MFAIVQAYIDIVMLRRGPETLPYSPPLLFLTIAALVTLVLASPAASEFTVGQKAIVVGMEVLMYCSVVWLLLNASARRDRFVQTMTAVFGADLLLKIMQLVIQAASPGTVDVSGDEPLSITTMLVVGLEFWFFAVMASILRAALAVGVLQSFGLVFLIMLLTLGALSIVLPELVAPA